VSDGFEELELLDPRWTLDHAGAAMFVIAPSKTRYRMESWTRGEAGSCRRSVEIRKGSGFSCPPPPAWRQNERYTAIY
jgi:hypothetical protein